jgi:mannose-6-phosphate isomerase
MRQILRLHNPVQAYAWGSHRAIAELLGQPIPSPQPQAELWMGDHPRAFSTALLEGGRIPLPDLIRQFPVDLLGDATARELPFLLKVLAAAEPLSIQAHPNTAEARAGCAREDAAGLPRDAETRGYRDASAKPELLYALEPFWILRGFRPLEAIFDLVQRFGLVGVFPACGQLRDKDVSRALQGFLNALMELEKEATAQLVEVVVGRAREQDPEDHLSHWICELDRLYPGDRGVLAPLFLHLVRLEPGEVMYTGAGVLHAYLEGVGIELMANSDNVLRGGLTAKHINPKELLSILRFEQQPPGLLKPVLRGAEQSFEVPEAGLSLGHIRIQDGQ